MGVRAFGTQRRFTTGRARLRLPRAVAAVSAAGLCAGVTLLGAGTAQAATGFGVTATIGVQINPDAVAVDSSTGTVYVANAGNSSVSVIANNNGTPTTVGHTIPTGANPDAVAVDPATHTVYVANGTSAVCGPPNNSAPGCENSVSVIDMSGLEPNTGTVIATIPVGTNPDAVAVDPATHTVYAANAGDGTVSVIDESTNQVTGTPIRVGANPDAVAVDPATHTVYAANAGDGTVSVIDESTNQVTGTPIRVGANPDAVAVDPATHTVYVTNNAAAAGSLLEDRSVSVINGNQVTNIPLGPGDFLRGVAVDPATHNVYVTEAGGVVAVIKMSGGTGTVSDVHHCRDGQPGCGGGRPGHPQRLRHRQQRPHHRWHGVGDQPGGVADDHRNPGPGDGRHGVWLPVHDDGIPGADRDARPPDEAASSGTHQRAAAGTQLRRGRTSGRYPDRARDLYVHGDRQQRLRFLCARHCHHDRLSAAALAAEDHRVAGRRVPARAVFVPVHGDGVPGADRGARPRDVAASGTHVARGRDADRHPDQSGHLHHHRDRQQQHR